MKPEEAIGIIKEMNYKWCHELPALNLAIEALEKQIAKKPIERPPFRSIGKCPRCGSNISIHNSPGFCGWCGKAIDWSDTL